MEAYCNLLKLKLFSPDYVVAFGTESSQHGYVPTGDAICKTFSNWDENDEAAARKDLKR